MVEHRMGRNKGNSFTGRYYCYKLVYYEEHESILRAIEREKEIKLLSRADKLNLIYSINPKMHTLNLY